MCWKVSGEEEKVWQQSPVLFICLDYGVRLARWKHFLTRKISKPGFILQKYASSLPEASGKMCLWSEETKVETFAQVPRFHLSRTLGGKNACAQHNCLEWVRP